MDMDAAAKYIQRKWNWYQTEGKLLAKKKKGKKGGKKKKKWSFLLYIRIFLYIF